MPGTYPKVSTNAAAFSTPLLLTTRPTFEKERADPGRSGTWKLICSCPLTLATANRGAGMPPKSTDVPAISVGKGVPLAVTIPLTLLNPVPKTVPMPSATGAFWKLAPLTTDELVICGAVPVGAILSTKIAKVVAWAFSNPAGVNCHGPDPQSPDT